MQINSFHDKAIVIIDHNPHFLVGMREIFARLGYGNVYAFESAHEATKFINKYHHAIYKVYIDLILYPIPGSELLKCIVDQNLSPMLFTMMSEHSPFPESNNDFTTANIGAPIIKPTLLDRDAAEFQQSIYDEMLRIDQLRNTLSPVADNDSNTDMSLQLRQTYQQITININIPETSAPTGSQYIRPMLSQIGAKTLYDLIKPLGRPFIEAMLKLGKDFLFN